MRIYLFFLQNQFYVHLSLHKNIVNQMVIKNNVSKKSSKKGYQCAGHGLWHRPIVCCAVS